MAAPIDKPRTTPPTALTQDRRREIAIAVAFVALCGVGLWTVVIPELRGTDPDERSKGISKVRGISDMAEPEVPKTETTAK